jgi:hypothetical protein
MTDIKRVGRTVQPESDLLNTYFLSNSGLLVPDIMFFYSDSMGRAVASATASFIRAYDEGEHSLLKEVGMSIDSVTDRIKHGLDEILTICDPENSFGTVEREQKGFYMPIHEEYLNTEILRQLFIYAEAAKENFNPKDAGESFKQLLDFWGMLETKYYQFSENTRSLVAEASEVGIEEILKR